MRKRETGSPTSSHIDGNCFRYAKALIAREKDHQVSGNPERARNQVKYLPVNSLLLLSHRQRALAWLTPPAHSHQTRPWSTGKALEEPFRASFLLFWGIGEKKRFAHGEVKKSFGSKHTILHKESSLMTTR